MPETSRMAATIIRRDPTAAQYAGIPFGQICVPTVRANEARFMAATMLLATRLRNSWLQMQIATTFRVHELV